MLTYIIHEVHLSIKSRVDALQRKDFPFPKRRRRVMFLNGGNDFPVIVEVFTHGRGIIERHRYEIRKTEKRRAHKFQNIIRMLYKRCQMCQTE